MNSKIVELSNFLKIENSILEQFSRTMFQMRKMHRSFIELVLNRNNIYFIRIKAMIQFDSDFTKSKVFF